MLKHIPMKDSIVVEVIDNESNERRFIILNKKEIMVKGTIDDEGYVSIDEMDTYGLIDVTLLRFINKFLNEEWLEGTIRVSIENPEYFRLETLYETKIDEEWLKWDYKKTSMDKFDEITEIISDFLK